MKDRGNLRPAPAWITPDLVKRVLDLFGKAPVVRGSVDLHPTPVVRPTLKLVVNDEPIRVTRSRRLRATAIHPDWMPEEDERLRDAYAKGERIDLLAKDLGRTKKSAYSRAEKLKLAHPRPTWGGFVDHASWSEEEDAELRGLYGTIRTSELAEKLGRTKPAIYNRANILCLVHGGPGYYSSVELSALSIAHERGLAIGDVAKAIGRNAKLVAKSARRRGMVFGHRSLLAEPITIEGILALAGDAPLPPTARDVRNEKRAKAAKAKRAEIARLKAVTAPTPARDAAWLTTKRPKADPIKPPAPRTVPARVEAAPVPARPLPLAPKPILPLGAAAYAAAINAAKAYLEARHCTVRKVDRDALIARWTVTGFYGSFDNAELVELAARMGMAQVA